MTLQVHFYYIIDVFFKFLILYGVIFSMIDNVCQPWDLVRIKFLCYSMVFNSLNYIPVLINAFNNHVVEFLFSTSDD